MTDIFAELRKPFPRELISWRVGATNKNKNGGKATKGIALAYIDARDVMQRLDDVVGPQNWQALHPHANGKTSCKVGIRNGSVTINGSEIKAEEWVWKENGAGDSAMDAEKGAFSDSFKRAAVLWGVGRYLYDVPNIWVDLDEWGQIKDKNDPRLFRALESAEKGIRGSHEPEPEPVKAAPFSDAEYIALKVEIETAVSVDDMTELKKKARAAWSRMIPEQQDGITKIIKSAEARIGNVL